MKPCTHTACLHVDVIMRLSCKRMTGQAFHDICASWYALVLSTARQANDAMDAVCCHMNIRGRLSSCHPFQYKQAYCSTAHAGTWPGVPPGRPSHLLFIGAAAIATAIHGNIFCARHRDFQRAQHLAAPPKRISGASRAASACTFAGYYVRD